MSNRKVGVERSAVPPSTAIVPGALLPGTDPRPSDSSAQISVPKKKSKFFSKTKADLPPKKKRRIQRRPWRKLPAESRQYKAVMAILAMKVQGKKYEEIAEVLGLSVQTCKNYLYNAHKHNQINFDSFTMPQDQLDIVLTSKAVRNVNLLLDGGIEACPGDKDTTLKVMEGLGMFKQHQVVKGEGGAPMGIALQVQIQMPPDSASKHLQLRDGSVGGQPFTDADFEYPVSDD